MKESTMVFESFLGLFIFACLAAPVTLAVYFIRGLIRSGLAGLDGVVDAQELRIALMMGVVVLFNLVFLWMLITQNALKWHYDPTIYAYVFFVIIGAEATAIVTILDKIKLKK